MTVSATNGQNSNAAQFTITFTGCGKYVVVISH
jgi:hypothetical protein